MNYISKCCVLTRERKGDSECDIDDGFVGSMATADPPDLPGSPGGESGGGGSLGMRIRCWGRRKWIKVGLLWRRIRNL